MTILEKIALSCLLGIALWVGVVVILKAPPILFPAGALIVAGATVVIITVWR